MLQAPHRRFSLQMVIIIRKRCPAADWRIQEKNQVSSGLAYRPQKRGLLELSSLPQQHFPMDQSDRIYPSSYACVCVCVCVCACVCVCVCVYTGY